RHLVANQHRFTTALHNTIKLRKLFQTHNFNSRCIFVYYMNAFMLMSLCVCVCVCVPVCQNMDRREGSSCGFAQPLSWAPAAEPQPTFRGIYRKHTHTHTFSMGPTLSALDSV